MTFDNIQPYETADHLPDNAKIPSALQKLLGINNQGQQNTWGKILNWVPGLDIGAAIGDKAVANKYGKGTDAYENLNTDAKNAAVGFGTEAATAGKEALDFFTGNFGGMGKDALNFGKTVAASGKQNALPGSDILSGLGIGGNTPALHPWIANMAKMPLNIKTPDNGDNSYPDEEGNANTDPNATPPMVGGEVGQGLTKVFRRGGLLAGGSHEEGGIALIDLLTGKDTGYRVEGGERIVNDEDYNAIKKMVKNKHHRKALALLEDIEKRKPETKEYQSGGIPISKNELQELTDAQIAALYRKSAKVLTDFNPFERDAIQKEIDRRGFTTEWLDGNVHDKGGKQITPDKTFDVDKWHKTVAPEKPQLKEGAVNSDSEVMADKYSNANEAVYKNGKWYHTQGDDKGNSVDESLQKSLTDEYLKKQTPTLTGKDGAEKTPKGDPNFRYSVSDDGVDEKTPAPVKHPDIVSSAGGGTGGKTPLVFPNGVPEVYKVGGSGTDAQLKQAPDEQPTKAVDATTNTPATDATTGTGNKTDIKSLIGDAAGTGFDAMRLGLGLIGATKKLKDFNVPTEFTDYENKARYFSEVGLTPEEKALANSTEQNNYGQAVNAITNASGGNAGSVLANLSRVNAGRGQYALAMAAKDADLKAEHLQNFLPILNEDIGFKKEEFDRHYNQDLATKQAGAQLASDAISNIKSRFDYNKNYGSGSAYDELTKNLVAQGKSQAEILQAQADYWKNPANYLSAGKTYSPYNYNAHLPASGNVTNNYYNSTTQ